MSETPEEPLGPRRVIGTPSPAPKAVDVPAEPSQPRVLGRAGRTRGTRRTPSGSSRRCSCSPSWRAVGFIAAFIGLEVGSATIAKGANPVVAVARSNLALGTALAVALLALGTGSMIWVRHLTPNIEIAEERHDLASAPEDRKAFKREFAEGAAISQVTKRPLMRRTMLLATAPLALAPLVLLRDLGPLPQTDLRHTVWRKGLRAVTLGGLRPLTPSRHLDPGQPDHRHPRGLPGRRQRPREGRRHPDQVRAGRAARPDQLQRRDAGVDDELDGRQHRRLLQDLHPRRLPGRAVRADHPPHPLPVPPVDLRRGERRQRDLRPGGPRAAAAAAHD